MRSSPKILLIVLGIAAMPAVSMACAIAESPAGAHPAERCNAPEPADGRVSAHQIDTIMAWLADRFDLPRSAERPAIVFESPARLARMRRGGFVQAPPTQDFPDAGYRSGQGDILALYNDGKRSIHLSEGWTATTDANMSVLVHEMVHHLQNVAGLKYMCASERETIAYQAQEAWLQQFGKSLESEFGVDAFTLLVRGSCL